VKQAWVPTPLPTMPARATATARTAIPPRRGGAARSLWQLLRFAGFLFALRFRALPTLQKAERVRAFLEQRGGLWIKIAQTLASRHDVLPAVYCEELGKLFDRATAYPWEQARQALESSLGQPLDVLFDSFDTQPLAAASIAQTYRARLNWNGAEVAVKVRRPYIDEIFRRDLKLVRAVAWLFNLWPGLRHLNLLDMHGELEAMLLEELDFRIEATLIRDMRRNLKPRGVEIPRVYRRYCNKEVIVMSFIDGVLMADYLRLLAADPLIAKHWLEENHINPKKVARKIYLSCQRQIFEDNMFHGDLHPGNIMLLRHSRFALLDFGAVGTLDLQTRKQVMLYHRLVAEGDLSKAMMVLTHMSSPVPQGNLASLLRRLTRVTQASLRFMTVKHVPYEERIYSDATSRQLKLLGQARIPVSWDFLRAQRTFTVLEMSMRQLDPSMEPMKLSRAYFQRRRERAERQAGGRHEQLFNHVEALVTDASAVMRELADVRALAGKIWGMGLDEMKTLGRRALLWLSTAAAGIGGLLWAGHYYLGG